MRDLLTRIVCEDKSAWFDAVLPLTSASSSLVLSLSIFSFQSLERSFSIQEDSEGRQKRSTLNVWSIVIFVAIEYCVWNISFYFI